MTSATNADSGSDHWQVVLRWTKAALLGALALLFCACERTSSQVSNTVGESPQTTTSTSADVGQIKPRVEALVVNGLELTMKDDVFSLPAEVNPGDEMVVEATISDDDPGSLEMLGSNVPYRPQQGTALIEFTVHLPADLASTRVPIAIGGREVGILELVPGALWTPVITIEDQMASTGEIALRVRVSDLNGPESLESLIVQQEFNFQHADHAREVIAAIGGEPLSFREVASGATEVLFEDPRYDFRFTTNREVSEYISNTIALPIDIVEQEAGLYELRFRTEWPGRLSLLVSVTDDNGNTTTDRVPVEVQWSESVFEIRGMGTGWIVPGEPNFYDQYFEILAVNHVNHLQILIPGYMPSLTSSSVMDCDFQYTPDSPCSGGSPEAIGQMIQVARERGIGVMLVPQLVVGNWEPKWQMSPDWDSWFSLEPDVPSYANWILSWAEFAEENGVEHMSVGSELVRTHSQEGHWRRLIEAVRQIYSGAISYGDNSPIFFTDSPFPACDALDYYGLQLYYPGTGGEAGTAADSDPTIQEMVANISLQIEEIFLPIYLQNCSDTPVFISEMSMLPVDGGNTAPEVFWGEDFQPDFQEHAEWVDAVLRVAQQYGFVGAIPWNLQPQANPWRQHEVLPGDIRDLPALDAIRIHYSP